MVDHVGKAADADVQLALRSLQERNSALQDVVAQLRNGGSHKRTVSSLTHLREELMDHRCSPSQQDTGSEVLRQHVIELTQGQEDLLRQNRMLSAQVSDLEVFQVK